jgi:aminoglycoside phosphotransferase (APT) family kinase protein
MLGRTEALALRPGRHGMTDVTSEVPDGFDVDRMLPAVARCLDAWRPPARVERLTGGRSNLTYRVTDVDGRDCVVRRPPMGDVLPTAHDMGREHRILAALGAAGFRVPRVAEHVPGEDGAAEFYVMEFVDGHVLENTDDARALAPGARRAAAEDYIDTLVELHAIDPDEVGLGDLARRSGYVERQLRRWQRQWELTRTEGVGDGMDAVHRRLEAAVPACDEVRVVHGDFRPGNCVFTDEGRLRAVLDWELCTLGDPLADVGYVALTWEEDGDPRPVGLDAPSSLPGFPTRRGLLERYAEASGRDLGRIDFYVAFQAWRMACINQGVYARYLSGDSGIPADDLEEMRESVDRLAAIADDLLTHRDTTSTAPDVGSGDDDRS